MYDEVKDAVIRSDVLRKREDTGVQDIFDGVTLVLSTLTMLSDPILNTCGLLSLIPVTTLVVDEASQIDVFEFMVTLAFTLEPRMSANSYYPAPILQVLKGSKKIVFFWRPETT